MGTYLVVAPGYPSEDNKYNNMFVHARVKCYVQQGLEVDVFSFRKRASEKTRNGYCYTYEDVNIEQGNAEELKQRLRDGRYSKILVHFCLKKIYNTIREAASDTPVIIWVHGYEALGWYRRLYDFRPSKIPRFLFYIMKNTRQLLFFRRLIRKRSELDSFVFVSNWMKRVTEKDTFCADRIEKYHIIPNIVDENVFPYHQKSEDDRLKILSIRPFQSRKYANDQTVQAIMILADKPFFSELRFTICGDGELWPKTIEPLKAFKNVTLRRGFLNHDEIAALHGEHGVMLIPTRQDAQGVSMCEGMSSGLVPVTSDNTAIPEFVPLSCGYLSHSAQGLADAIEELYYNSEKFLEYSKNASDYIRGKCATSVIIKKEVELITKQERVNAKPSDVERKGNQKA